MGSIGTTLTVPKGLHRVMLSEHHSLSSAVVCPCFSIGHIKGDGEKPVS